MATFSDPNVAANIAKVGEVASVSTGAMHFTSKPTPHTQGTGGHYRFGVRTIATTAQAANSRLLSIRNSSATNLLIIQRLVVTIAQIAAGTAQETSLDAFKLTGFTTIDTTNTQTPVPSLKRTGMAVASAAGVDVRALVATGAAAGMTGAVSTKDASPWSTMPHWVATTLITNPSGLWRWDVLDDAFGSHPWVFAQNEGLEIENRVLNATSDGLAYYFDCAFAIVTAY